MRSRCLSAVLLPAFFLAAVSFAALMQHSEATIPTPEIGARVPLSGLVYRSRRFEARISSVELVAKSAPDADPLAAAWVFTAGNSDGQLHRVEMQIRLLDESGKQIGWFTAKHPVRAGARDETFRIPMKVKRAVWGQTRKVRIFADWLS